MNDIWMMAALGGGLIGISVSIMLFFNGKVTGISGIFYGSTVNRSESFHWKIAFVLGLITSGLILNLFFPNNLRGHVDSHWWTLAVAGFLVGYGTRLGNGCTSGHGVCGVSRFSWRSILATLSFMIAGILSVTLFRQIGIIDL